MNEPIKVVYVLLYFPRLTETFIAREVWSLASQGVDVRIVSLLRASGDGPVQPRSLALMPRVSYAPGVLSWATVRAHAHYLATSPRVYATLLGTLLRQPYTAQPVRTFLKRMVTFAKAVTVAHSFRHGGIDLLHSHFAWLPGAAGWICSRLLRKPFTVTVHAYDIYSRKNDLLRLVSGAANHVVAISEFNRSHMQTLGCCPPDRISVIHCGIDLGNHRAPRTERSGRPGDGPIGILSVGSLLARKGHRELVEACHLLDQRGLAFTCTIIGGGPDEAVLREQIRTLGLQEKVVLRGALSQPEVVKAHRENDIFVLACLVGADGDMDGIPVALMEAGDAGLALVSTPVSGIPELVRDGETGLLVPPGDAPALAEAISTLALDSELRRRLTQNARALVRAEFNMEDSARQLAAVFRRAGEAKPVTGPR